MAKKKAWLYKAGIGKIRGLCENEAYFFNPKFQPDGTVKCKMSFGYNTQEEFYEDWKEV